MNALAAGPLATIAAEGHSGLQVLCDRLGASGAAGLERARPAIHGRADGRGPPVGLVPATTAEMVHVDGGRHAIGSPPVDVMERIRPQQGTTSAARRSDPEPGGRRGTAQARATDQAQNRFSATMSLLNGST